MHWSDKYIGLPWTNEHCCAYYFALIQQEVFGRAIDGERVSSFTSGLSAARVMGAIFADQRCAGEFGFVKTSEPKDGDAVFLSQRKFPHHIGTVAFIGKKRFVVHALEGTGMIRSSRIDLNHNGWKSMGYWTWKSAEHGIR